MDGGTGVPQALLDGASLTAIRTAAACGLATNLLARPDSRVLAVFGSGVHARTQVEAVRTVREIEEIRVCNANFESARSMVRERSANGPMLGKAGKCSLAFENIDELVPRNLRNRESVVGKSPAIEYVDALMSRNLRISERGSE